jgi:2-polyprenyl-3-methyl-5-hydroxy-6-metoxy-1,4-benzoquinol methylase
MIDLRTRSYEKEVMDSYDIPFPVMKRTLKELNVVNTLLGGHAVTVKGTEEFIDGSSLTICEIGCGGGDNLFALNRHCAKKNIPVDFIGVDINPECIAFARERYVALPCRWIISDYRLVDFEEKPDIIFSSLFCHHFTHEQLIEMMQWLRENSLRGFFINDLHRHWLAFYLIKYITKFFSRSYLVKNDASLSVARSFKKKDWEKIFEEAGIGNYSIHWEWAFRFLITCKN